MSIPIPILCEKKDFRSMVARIKLGQTSAWIEKKTKAMCVLPHEFYSWNPEYISTDKFPVRIRFKIRLDKLSKDGKHLELFRSPLYNSWGWAYPEVVGKELIDHFCEMNGKDWEESEAYAVENNQNVRIIKGTGFHLRWVGKTTCYLAEKYAWDILFAQVHTPDTINHAKLAKICKGTKGYDPQEAPQVWNDFRNEYRAMDKMVGEIVNTCADKDTAIAVISDHGCIPAGDKRVWPQKALVDAGLCKYRFNKTDGNYYLDLKKSKAILTNQPLPDYVYVNLKGRDPYGMVKPGKEYEQTRQEIITVLNNLRDPHTGESPLIFVNRWEDMQSLGFGGENVGDVVFFFREGYLWIDSRMIFGPISKQEMQSWSQQPVQQYDGYAQHVFCPWAEYMGMSNRGTFMFSCPDLAKEDMVMPDPVWMIDAAPTLARICGIKPPKDCDGKSIIGF